MEAPASIDLTIGPPDSAGARLLSARLPGSTLSARLPGLADPALLELAARWRRRALSAAEVNALGDALFAALLEPIRSDYEIMAAGLAPDGAMRLALRFDQSDPVAALPWELLRHPLHGALAFRGVSLLRTLTHATTPPGPVVPTLPLRVLLTSAGDSSDGALAAELGAVAAALEPFRPDMELHVERRLTPERLAELLAEPFHIWHFVGHGGMGLDGPRLYLEDKIGDRFAIDAMRLEARVRASSLRLVVLDACDSAAIPPEQQAGGLQAIAPALVAAGAPAVIGMQAAADIEAARRFASGLYAALARGLPPDRSMSVARQEVAELLAGAIADWAVPVVYVGDPQADLGLPWPRPACPYPGLVPFGSRDKERFFGREQEIEDLRTMVTATWHDQPDRVSRVLVIGPSGSGKSSLVRAGLLPKLEAAGWKHRELRPGADPLAALAAALAGLPEQPGQRLLLVDQLEELFTLAPREAQAPFAAALADLSGQGWRLLVTVRADFFGDLMSSRLWPFSASERLDIAPLRGDQLREAIVRPATKAGVQLAPELIEQLVADAADEPGALPLVQVALVQLWKSMDARRTIPASAYRPLAQAIERHANAVLADLDDAGRSIASRILVRLVQFGEGRAHTRRRQPIDALRSEGDNARLFNTTIRTLTDSRLLTVAGDLAGTGLVDLSHEALIKDWPQLQGWIEKRRGAEEYRRRLEAKVEEWVARGRGAGALLDEIELAEVEGWLADPQTAELGVHPELPVLVERSRDVITERIKEIERLRNAAVVRGVAAIAKDEFREAQHERAALLAFHAYQFDQRSGGMAHDEVDRALREILAAERFSIMLAGSAAAFSPDGRWIAASEADGTVRLWNIAGQGRPQETLGGATSRARAIVFSPNGTMLAIGGWDRRVHLWNLVRHTHHALDAVYGGRSHGLAFSPDGATLAIAGHELLLWDVRRPEQAPRAIFADREGIYAVAYAPDRTLAAGLANSTVYCWKSAESDPLVIAKGQQRVLALAFSPESKLLAVGSHGLLSLYNYAGEPISEQRFTIAGEVRSLSFSADGQALWLGSSAGQAERRMLIADGDPPGYRLEPGEQIASDRGDIQAVLSPDGALLATCSPEANTIRVWRLGPAVAPERVPARLRRDKGGTFFSLDVSPDGSVLTIRGAGVRFALFRRSAAGWHQDKRAANDEQPDGGSISATALSNSHLARAIWDGTILITKTSAPDGPAVALSNPYAAEVLSLAFDSPGRLLAALVRPLAEDEIAEYEQAAEPGEEPPPKRAPLADADPSCTVLLWDLAIPGQAPVVLGGPRQAAAEPGYWASKVIAFSPDSNLLAACDADDCVRVWRLSDIGAQPLRLPSHTSLIRSLSFGPEERLAVAGGFGKLRVWDLRAPADSPAPGGGSATAAAYDPAGARLAVGDDKGTIQLWQTDRYDRKPIVLRGHDLQITQLIWAGGRLFSSSADGSVKAWLIETSELAGIACSLVWRNLSEREWLEFVGPDLPYEAACPALPVPPDS